MNRTRGQIAAVLLLLMTCFVRVWTAAGISGPTPDRQGELLLDETLAALQKRADLEPNNPEAWVRLAEFYSEKVRTDTKLPSALAKQHVMSGLKFVSHALMFDPHHQKALIVNSALLIQRSRYETDHALRKGLIEQAEALKRRAERGQ